MMRHLCLLFLLCIGSLWSSVAQGPGLLIQQYSKASYDLEYYRKWNFDVLLQPHLSKPTNRESKGKTSVKSGWKVCTTA